jgi:N-acetylmuramoyl-L-alanine amidase
MKIPGDSRKFCFLSVAALTLCLFSPPGHGEEQAFVYTLDGVPETVQATLHTVQGVPRVSLPRLTRALGGGSRVLPARIEVTFSGASAVAGINDVTVQAPGQPFDLMRPLLLLDGDVLIAVQDVPRFYMLAFGREVKPADTGAAGLGTPPEPAPGDERVLVRDIAEGIEEELTAEDALTPAALLEETLTTVSGDVAEPADLLDPVVTEKREPGESPAAEGGSIILDAGHGGRDAGTAGAAGLAEKDLCLAVARMLGQKLKESTGLRIFLTRSGDQGLSMAQRTASANQYNGSLYVSLHAGAAFSPGVSGYDVFYNGSVSESRGDSLHLAASRRLAQSVASGLTAKTEARARGIWGVPLQGFGDLDMPAVLVEIGYLTNPGEEARLATENCRETIAAGIAAGIREYLDATQAGADR